MKKGARKALARALGKGPLRPMQLSAIIFSSTLLLCGVIALAVFAIPYLQSGAARAGQVSVAPVLKFSSDAVVQAKESPAEGGTAPSDEPGVAGIEGDSAAEGVATGSGALSLFPSVDSLKSTVAVAEQAAHGSAGQASGSGGQLSASSGAGSSAGSAGGGSSSNATEAGGGSSGLTEVQEQEFLAFLRQRYDALAPLQQRLMQAYAELPTLGLEPSSDTRLGYCNNAISLRDSIDVAFQQMEIGDYAQSSRYYQAYQNIYQLYFDLSSAGALLARAWLTNTMFDDPAANVDAWMSPIYENSSGGKVTFLADYEARYPGARP